MIRRVLLPTLLTVGLLGGCRQAPSLDATSYETLASSLNRMATQLPKRDRERFEEARRDFNALYFPDGRDSDLPEGLASWRSVHGMTIGEFLRFVRQQKDLAASREEEYEAIFPNPALSHRLLSQYRDELDLLMIARSRQHDAGLNTVDQYPILDVGYIPPMTNVPIEMDHATFVVTLRNETQFDAYRPRIRIRVVDPNQEIPILEREWEYNNKQDPIGPGETVTMRFECCSALLDPIHNNLLKKASPDTSIEVELLDIRSHNNKQLIDTRSFSLKDAQRIRVLTRCIERIEADIANWVPYAEADQPGGCGDPRQEENLIAMWREQGIAPPREFRHLVIQRQDRTNGNDGLVDRQESASPLGQARASDPAQDAGRPPAADSSLSAAATTH